MFYWSKYVQLHRDSPTKEIDHKEQCPSSDRGLQGKWSECYLSEMFTYNNNWAIIIEALQVCKQQ